MEGDPVQKSGQYRRIDTLCFYLRYKCNKSILQIIITAGDLELHLLLLVTCYDESIVGL